MLFNKSASLFLALACATVMGQSSLVINEIMRNPASVTSERLGEWFELYNPSDTAVDINGWTIKDDGTNEQVIAHGSPLWVAPGGYFVLGNNGDLATNGGVHVDYVYDSGRIFLNNGNDELVLLNGALEQVDRVDWDGGETFPNVDGAAMALLDSTLDNNEAKHWCNAVTPYGSGDKGTPGAPNDCPPPRVVISEIMRNPTTVSDRLGEWFELYNPSPNDIDINGWTIKDDGKNLYVIDNGGPLFVSAGGYLVLGNNADFGTNGGVHVDYEYDGNLVFLNNAGDELVLLVGSVEVDRVNWDGSGGVFPSENGAAMALKDAALDNNVATNWCNAATIFGDGDKGTPGAPNDCSVRRALAGSGSGVLRGSA